jgi:hypothetical protein
MLQKTTAQSGMDNPELLAILVIKETGRRQNQNTEGNLGGIYQTL